LHPNIQAHKRLSFQHVPFLRVKCNANQDTQIYRITLIFGMASEQFPSRQDAVKVAENINNTGLAIFHFTDVFEHYCISIPQTAQPHKFRQRVQGKVPVLT
jgi:hypothetical protein